MPQFRLTHRAQVARNLAILLGFQATLAFADEPQQPPPPPPPPTQFTIVDLGLSTGAASSEAIGLTNNGLMVVREFDAAGKAKLFLVKDGVKTDLGTLGGDVTSAVRTHRIINEAGQIVGHSKIATSEDHAFLWNGAIADLGLAGVMSHAAAINETGQIVGDVQLSANDSMHAFLYNSDGMKDLGAQDGLPTSASAINASGLIAGWYGLQGTEKAFVYADGAIKPLGCLPERDVNCQSMASAINDRGQVVGALFDGQVHIFLHEKTPDGKDIMRSLGALPEAQACSAGGINDQTWVVGHCSTDKTWNTARAFFFDGQKMVDLSTLLPAESGWTTLKAAHAINKDGHIAGVGVINGAEHAFLMKPVPVDQPPPVMYKLTVKKDGDGTGLVAGPGIQCDVQNTDCTEDYPTNTQVVLDAKPDNNATVSWVNCPGNTGVTGTSCIINMTADVTVTATFTAPAKPVSYTVTATAGEHGTITPPTQVINANTAATLVVTPAEGYSAVVTGCNGTLTGNTYTTAPVAADCAVTATFGEVVTTAAKYTVKVTVGEHGILSPNTTQTVEPNAKLTFTAKPETDYLAVVTGCSGMQVGNIYTTASITADCAVSATFVPKTASNWYTVSAGATKGGVISPRHKRVRHGTSLTFTVKANRGYAVDAITNTCAGSTGTLTGNRYAIGPITANCAVKATFKALAKTYVVIPTVGRNGTINPAVPQKVAAGETATFIITPNTGYQIAKASGCDGTLTGNIYTTGATNRSCTVNVKFSSLSAKYTVKATATEGGTVSPGAVEVVSGKAASFEVKPEKGYTPVITNTCVGAAGVLVGNRYAVGPINADCTVAVAFEAAKYTVTPNVGANGKLDPAIPQVVVAGSVATFTVTPNDGYVATVKGCDGQLAGNTYTTGSIKEDCAIDATFSQVAGETHTVKISTGKGGVVIPSREQKVADGQTATFTIIPSDGRTVTATGCAGQLVGNIYTTGAITENCTIIVTFGTQRYTVAASGNAGGTVSPASQSVKAGEKARVSIVPNGGYTAAVTGCDGELRGKVYTIEKVTENCEVVATFTKK